MLFEKCTSGVDILDCAAGDPASPFAACYAIKALIRLWCAISALAQGSRAGAQTPTFTSARSAEPVWLPAHTSKALISLRRSLMGRLLGHFDSHEPHSLQLVARHCSGNPASSLRTPSTSPNAFQLLYNCI